MSAKMDLSIIIVNWNTKDFLLDCLESLFRHPPSREFEVIIIDNASTDGSVLLVQQKFPQVKLILNQSNKGFATANNQGLKIMKGNFALLLNPDTIVIEESIDKMIKFMETNERIGILGCKIKNPDGSLQASAFPHPTMFNELISGLRSNLHYLGKFISYLSNRSTSWGDRPTPVGWVSGACLMIRKKTIEEIGYMDEKIFLFGEDLDWCLRARKGGWEVFYLPQPFILHFGGQSTKKNLTGKIYSFYYKRFYLTKKYRSGISLLLLKLISIIELLTKSIIINLNKNIETEEKISRLKGYRKSYRLIFKKLDQVRK